MVMVERSTGDRMVATESLCYGHGRAFNWGSNGCYGVTVLWSWARHFIRCLVLFQTSKTRNRPEMTENY